MAKSRYIFSGRLQHTTTDYEAGVSTKFEYYGPRITSASVYPRCSIIQYRGEDIDNMAYQTYGDEQLWWVIAERNNIMFPWAINTGEILEVPPFSSVANYI